MGRSCTRRSSALRVPHSGRRTGRIELEHHFEKARELPKGIRRISPGKDRPLRQARRAAVAPQRWDRAEPVENRSCIENAKNFLGVKKEFGSFDAYLWTFVGGKPIDNHWRTLADVPARTAESDAMSRDLLRRGFRFVGSTICYAFMQAIGMVNDHLVTCPRHAELGGSRQCN